MTEISRIEPLLFVCLKDFQGIKMTANIYAHLDTARKNTIADFLAGKFGIA